MAKVDKSKGDPTDLRHPHPEAQRTNNPPAGLAADGHVPILPAQEYHYRPRQSPKLRFDPTGKSDRLPELLEEAKKRALTGEEAAELAEALRSQEPYLEWAGKLEADRSGLAVDPVALHIHERLSTKAIVAAAAREDVQRGLFADPEMDYQDAVQFYRHPMEWTNRLILGDSLAVMSSLARREDLAGKVQMIYMDPPYGIKFASNFQPEVHRRDVKEKEQDLTREPEMVRAYRDTWHLGIHSYLSYLRDRLAVAKELLADSGSIFVQISDENVHRVRQLLDEVFSSVNFVAQINYRSMTPLGQTGMAKVFDYLLWYCRDNSKMKFRALYKGVGLADEPEFCFVAAPGGSALRLANDELESIDDPGAVFKRAVLTSSGYTPSCTFAFKFQGKTHQPLSGKSWRTTDAGISRLIQAERLFVMGTNPYFRQALGDFGRQHLENSWLDTAAGFSERKRYVVQTNEKIVERCLLMTTDSGDLVLDPTCGSGTTAYVAEQWGRRWITVDTSRVAVAIARQRLLTAKFDAYRLRELNDEDRHRNPAGAWLRDPDREIDGPVTLDCDTVPHITLKSIAQNKNLDPIFDKWEPILYEAYLAANRALKDVPGETRARLLVKAKQSLGEKKARSVGNDLAKLKKALSDADWRRWVLPPDLNTTRNYTEVRNNFEGWYPWEMPFDTDPDYPEALQQAVTEYRRQWRGKMDEVNDEIKRNAKQEELVDKPKTISGRVRVSGPFTVESVHPAELSLGEAKPVFDGAPEELEGEFESRLVVRHVESRGDVEARNRDAYLDEMVRLLRMDGVRFPDNRQMMFSRLERITGQDVFHAEGRWFPEGDEDADPRGVPQVGVIFGPQYGPITAKMVEENIKPASYRYEDLIFAGFVFDGAAQAAIEGVKHPKLRIHMAHIRPDVNPGMKGLLKEQPRSQLFSVFGRPRVRLESDGDEFVIHLEGVDIYDPVENRVEGTGSQKVAAWFLDSDYDGRTFCVTQAFFPDKDAWEKLAKALNNSGSIDPVVFENFSGTTSVPFAKGQHGRAAVKVIDARGNEVMKVVDLA